MAAADRDTQAVDPDGSLHRRLVVAGSGEHARVVTEAAIAAGWEVIGWTGPAADRTALGPVVWLGTDEAFASRLLGQDLRERPALVLGFGGPVEARRRVVGRFGSEARWARIVHPAAWVSPSAVVGSGSVVLAGAVVNTGATLGDHAIVNSGAIVEHDVTVGTHAHIGPGAAIGGGAHIGDGTFVGLNAAVRDHVRVGANATVGMGAILIGPVRDGATVTGNPAVQRPA
jgi:acetyltransferase EpsM